MPGDAALPSGRRLPPHIAAQLRSAGRDADTAGQPWAGRDLAHGHGHRFAGDRGAVDAALARELARRDRGEGEEAAVVAALAGARVFVPVMAEVSASTVTEEGLVADKEAEMALVTLTSRAGRRAQPVFGSAAEVTAWRRTARPVAADLRRVALSAVQDGAQLLVVGPAAPAPFVVRRPALWALAQGRPWVPSYRSHEVARAVVDAALGLPGLVGASVRPGRGVDVVLAEGLSAPGGGEGPELTAVLQLRPGLSRSEVDGVVAGFQRRVAASDVIADAVDSLEIALESAAV